MVTDPYRPKCCSSTRCQNHPVNIAVRIDLAVNIGGRIEIGRFNVSDRLATEVILVCDYCDKHIESIRPLQRLVELDEGTSVLIIRKPSLRARNTVPLSEEQEYQPESRRISQKVSVVMDTVLQPESHNWLTVSTQREGLIIIEPNHRLYEKHSCLAGTGKYQAQPGTPFKILVASFSSDPFPLLANQVVATAGEHPMTLVETNISQAEMLGIVDSDTKYRKREFIVRDVNIINSHLSDAREEACKADEIQITADNV